MKGSTVVIVGAGFSKPAGGPLMAELLDSEYCQDERVSRPGFVTGVKSDMARRRGQRTSYSYEDYFSEIYREARTGATMRFPDAEFGADQWLSEIVAHLASVTSRVKLKRNTRVYAAYKSFLERLPVRSTTFISFNYDLLLEQLFADIGIAYTYGLPLHIEGARPPTIGDSARQMRLFKLHGSVNWLVCRGCATAGSRNDRVNVLEKAYVPHQRKTCPACADRYGEVAIVPPIYGKAGEAAYLLDVWKKARAELRDAARVIIIGYSLPPSDVEARSLLTEISHEVETPILLVSGKEAMKNYRNQLPWITDSQMFGEEFLEHMEFAATRGISAYRDAYSNAIPALGRFYVPQSIA